MNLFCLGFVVILMAAAVQLLVYQHYWVYIPALIDYVKYPVLPNRPVHWRPGRKSRFNMPNSNDKPNIVVILVDDLGFNDISIFGGGFNGGNVHTPNIDSIGRDGIAFFSNYAGHATCAPSRAALLTGQFPTRVGYEYTPISDDGAKVLGSYMNYNELPGIFHADKAKGFSWGNMGLSPDAVTIAEVMRENSYKTIQIGKWHNGFSNTSSALARGFEETLGFSIISRYLPRMSRDAVNCVLPDVFDKFIWANAPYAVKKDDDAYFAPKGYLTDYLADEAVNAITANKDDPFFLFLAFTAIHTPLTALKSDFDVLSHIPNECDRVYAAMIVALDRAVGKVIGALEQLELNENTMIIFTSDNGGPGYIGQRHINDPYRGWKASFFEGGIRAPLLVKWPGVIAPAQRREEVVGHIDIFPTVLSAAGVNYTHILDGLDLMPYMKDASAYPESGSIHKILFWRSGHYMAARVGDWKIQSAENPKKMWLYNLRADPTETNNLAYNQEYKWKMDEMTELLVTENARQVGSQWPSLSETPLLVDKVLGDTYVSGDEYIYWSN